MSITLDAWPEISSNGDLTAGWLTAMRKVMVLAAGPAGIMISSHVKYPDAMVSARLRRCPVFGAGDAVGVVEYAGLNLDTGTVGVNGLDAGSLTPDTWYYVWLIARDNELLNLNHFGLLGSTSATAPALPPEYNLKSMVTCFRTDGAANIRHFNHQNQQYTYTTLFEIAAGIHSEGKGSLDVSQCIPFPGWMLGLFRPRVSPQRGKDTLMLYTDGAAKSIAEVSASAGHHDQEGAEIWVFDQMIQREVVCTSKGGWSVLCNGFYWPQDRIG